MHREAFFGDGWRAVAQVESAIIAGDLGARIEGEYLAQGYAEVMLKVVHPAKPGSELFLERGPGDELRLTTWHPVQPLRQPGVGIQGHCRMRETTQSVLVERYNTPDECWEAFT